MLRTLASVTLVLLFGSATGWALGGAYTTEFRVTPPAPIAPNPFSAIKGKSALGSFNSSTPQSFKASAFPDAKRNLGIFIRNRIISLQGRIHLNALPIRFHAPYWTCPNLYPRSPYEYDLLGIDPPGEQPNGTSEIGWSSKVVGSNASTGQQVVRTTKIYIQSAPAGADVYIDGDFVGDTPATSSLTFGLHTISIRGWGYRAWHRRLTLTPGSKIRIDAILKEN